MSMLLWLYMHMKVFSEYGFNGFMYKRQRRVKNRSNVSRHNILHSNFGINPLGHSQVKTFLRTEEIYKMTGGLVIGGEEWC